MQTLQINPYELPRISRLALALVSSVLTGFVATALLQWQTVAATVRAPDAIPTRIADTDRDGLSDLEESAYHTSIYAADSDGDGMNDGDEVTNGRNPLGEGPLPARAAAQQRGADRDHDDLADAEEEALGTNADSPDTDGDGFPDGLEVARGYDPGGQGRPRVEIAIPAIKVRAPLVWTDSTDEKTIEQDLARGVILFPGTAVPGHIGNAFVTGHSSDYLWQRGPYRDIFKNLPQLKEGDEVIFSFSYANGKQRTVTYSLNEMLVVAPTDRSLLSPTPTPTLTLVTCYPIGSNALRIAWRGTLVSQER
ncbi:hypothetical protein A3J43_00160 [Candidatus Uhrbacteria bacterium RIFCSPHIGHO2_12_FULL_54_23]|uniref:Sortase n=2 Tax=Candidatus Uhriibacteriota TaxID=1752732 RepID=A0A1F7UHJ6_9BACT|nr:MAG: hypothetical protein A3J43_00160 [Candidatus Uhrbacteria bacterium RIFCSPHIGHO2_12_FULL_54_23]OGL90073.1 MAG: hypothetical protein A3J36_01335 [Candidatus Uhrbacteria bacterium RIFCSPLOWO2_02_FULL_54_37]